MRRVSGPPEKGVTAYLIPFLLIILLLIAAFLVLQKNIRVDDLQRIFEQGTEERVGKANAVYHEGTVEIRPWSSDDWQSISSEATIEAGDSLRTGKDGILVMRFFEESEVRLSENTELTLVQLEKEDQLGNQVSLDLKSGRLWRRGWAGNTKDAVFTISMKNLIASMNAAAVIDLSVPAQAIRVIGGKADVTVIDDMNRRKVALKRLTLGASSQLVVEGQFLEKIRKGAAVAAEDIDPDFLSSEWYLWNREKEDALGLLTDIPKISRMKAPAPELTLLGPGLVIITFPPENARISGKILVTGTYDRDKIDKIFVNDEEATLGLANEWESAIELSDDAKEIMVTALEKGSEQKKLVKKTPVVVDQQGPILGKIIQPIIDENGYGVITGDRLELRGEVAEDAKKICVSHNDEEAFCLKQWKAGDKTYTYYGAVKYGNVVRGKNKYEISSSDDLGNISQKTISLFKDVPKPETKLDVDRSTTSTVPSSSSSIVNPDEISKPAILIPDPVSPYQTSEKTIQISGTVDLRARSILVNGKKAAYEIGSGLFDISLDLEPGETLVKIQAVDERGEKSKSALLTVLYLEIATPSSQAPETSGTAP